MWEKNSFLLYCKLSWIIYSKNLHSKKIVILYDIMSVTKADQLKKDKFEKKR